MDGGRGQTNTIDRGQLQQHNLSVAELVPKKFNERLPSLLYLLSFSLPDKYF
jgi:hypothetical protein